MTSDSVIQAGNYWTNFIYGGKLPEVTQTIFTNGALDPFRLVSITQPLNIDSAAFVFEKYGKSRDLSTIDLENDSPQLVAFKQYVLGQVMELFPKTIKNNYLFI